MKHGRSWAALALALAVGLAASVAVVGPSVAAGKASGASEKASKRRVALHQFTGVVTSYDKSSITVEKGGKKPKTMVFARHAEMSTQGDLARDAKVTVFYREEDGKPVAHKVVVKAEGSDPSP